MTAYMRKMGNGASTARQIKHSNSNHASIEYGLDGSEESALLARHTSIPIASNYVTSGGYRLVPKTSRGDLDEGCMAMEDIKKFEKKLRSDQY
mmetsp:Transcript_20394/g.31123  ORF Transcript_20394/g.31123 Transcript_20394/m.31123 type:complete len:93 (-) Transcript_20394:121-399(-)